MAEPTNGAEALAIVTAWIGVAALTHGRELDPTCLATFEAQNLEKFKEAFTPAFWAKSKATLEKVAELHGMLAAKLSLLVEPMAPAVSLRIFIEAGQFVRTYCPVLKSGATPTPGIGVKGDWCTWP